MWGAEQQCAHGLFITVGMESERVKHTIHPARRLKDQPLFVPRENKARICANNRNE